MNTPRNRVRKQAFLRREDSVPGGGGGPGRGEVAQGGPAQGGDPEGRLCASVRRREEEEMLDVSITHNERPEGGRVRL